MNVQSFESAVISTNGILLELAEAQFQRQLNMEAMSNPELLSVKILINQLQVELRLS